ncbi:unnamed protein product [Mycena citricolor]|uniref:Ribonuclease H1 N-terminal domain-containing protein n=1 Tax=Mycena citricolor TaxID=2018698 RepID=A0AAD2HRQ0_9AGAR|nr:unnamed protein product [Mycena citricolor]
MASTSHPDTSPAPNAKMQELITLLQAAATLSRQAIERSSRAGELIRQVIDELPEAVDRAVPSQDSIDRPRWIKLPARSPAEVANLLSADAGDLFYVVVVGREPGVYLSHTKADELCDHVPGQKKMRFRDRAVALDYYRQQFQADKVEKWVEVDQAEADDLRTSSLLSKLMLNTGNDPPRSKSTKKKKLARSEEQRAQARKHSATYYAKNAETIRIKKRAQMAARRYCLANSIRLAPFLQHIRQAQKAAKTNKLAKDASSNDQCPANPIAARTGGSSDNHDLRLGLPCDLPAPPEGQGETNQDIHADSTNAGLVQMSAVPLETPLTRSQGPSIPRSPTPLTILPPQVVPLETSLERACELGPTPDAPQVL